MTDRVFPSSKPAATVPSTTTAASAAAAAAAATKPSFNNQNRIPYRQPHHRRHHNRRNFCCCCFFWSILIFLILALLASIAASAIYILYRPHRPTFTISSLRISNLNLTASSDSSSFHLTTFLNLTITSKNPNNHVTFFYDTFTVLAFSNSIQIGNGTIPALISNKQNKTILRTTVSDSQDLDSASVNSLQSDLKKKTGFPLMILMNTKVKAKIGGLKSKKVVIRVKCDGIRGVAPKSKSPATASITDSECKVDLRIKIWRFTF